MLWSPPQRLHRAAAVAGAVYTGNDSLSTVIRCEVIRFALGPVSSLDAHRNDIEQMYRHYEKQDKSVLVGRRNLSFARTTESRDIVACGL